MTKPLRDVFLPVSYFFVPETGNLVVFYIVPLSLPRFSLDKQLSLIQFNNELCLKMDEKSKQFSLLLPVAVLKKVLEKADKLQKKTTDLNFWIVVGKITEGEIVEVEEALFDLFSLPSIEIAKLVGYYEAINLQLVKEEKGEGINVFPPSPLN